MQGEHDAGLVGVVHLLLVELDEGLLAHEHGVEDIALAQGHLRLEDDGLTGGGDQFHPHVAVTVDGHRLLTVVEVAVAHMRDMRA